MLLIGHIMSPDQAAQVFNNALNAPLNSLIAIIAIASLFVSFVVVGCVIFLAYKFGSPVVSQYQQQLDTNKRLTDIAEQNTKQVAIQQVAMEVQTAEMKKQTLAIDAQTVEIKTQSMDFRNYQTLVSDNMSAHDLKIEANTANILSLVALFDTLPQKIIEAIIDEMSCKAVLKEFQALRYEVTNVLSQMQAKRVKDTGTFPPMTAPPPSATTTIVVPEQELKVEATGLPPATP